MRRLALLLPSLLLLAPSTGAPAVPAEPHGRPVPEAAGPSAGRLLSELPLTFVDLGAGSVPYRATAGPAEVGFGRDGLHLALTDLAGTSARWGVRMTFPDARPTQPVALDRAPGIVSYFRGSPEEWLTGLPTYRGLRYGQLWPGIDLDYTGASGSLKYSFRVAPGADPGAIGLRWWGATVTPTEEGGLRIATPAGTLVDQAPVAWQPGTGGRAPVEARWDRRPDGAWGFQLGAMDHGRPLVIDPEVVFTQTIGGTGRDRGQDIAVDGSGATYVVGDTSPPPGSLTNDFPAVVGPDPSFNGNQDAFVAKVNPGGTGIAYAGFIGGTQFDQGLGIAVDGTGAAYVSGTTSSNSTTEAFPATVGPDTTYNGSTDAFVAKVKPDGTGLVYAGYVGGSAGEFFADVGVAGSGTATVAGSTSSGDFPGIVGPDTSFNGVTDAFVARVKADGTGFDYSGFIGGTESDEARGVAVDGSGVAYVAGTASSNQTTFPDGDPNMNDAFPVPGLDQTHNGSNDAFVAKVKTDGTGLVYAGYIGGLASDLGREVAVDGSGAAYVAGSTSSDETTEGFPVAVGPDLTYAGTTLQEGFIAKVRADGSGLDYAGYVGGSDTDRVNGVAVDAAGSAYVVGETQSTETGDGFPATGGPDSTFNGGVDGFVGRVLPSGAGFAFLGYIGGVKFDFAFGVALDPAGVVYVTGDTDPQATFPSPSGISTHPPNAFVVALAEMCRGTVATIAGTGAKDKLTGTNGPDVIAAGGGKDTVNGKGGKDLICGGEGNDKLKGGGGKDKLYGEEGKDALIGQAGSDMCVGGPLKDRAKDCEKERQI